MAAARAGRRARVAVDVEMTGPGDVPGVVGQAPRPGLAQHPAAIDDPDLGVGVGAGESRAQVLRR
jgi:hypothetical protein